MLVVLSAPQLANLPEMDIAEAKEPKEVAPLCKLVMEQRN